MIRMLIVTPKKEDSRLLYQEAKEQAALLTQDNWEIRVENTYETAMEGISGLLDIVYMEITLQNGIRAVEKLRKDFRNVYLVLIVSAQLSPLYYLKPSVMPASILIQPLEKKRVRENIREAISWLSSSGDEAEEMFIIAERDGKVRIPFRKILYFEARAKRIYAAMETEEYGFYDSMEHLLERLPDFFCRCYRGFIVNTKYMKKVQPGSNSCLLQGDIEIPLSRSYRQSIKEYFA